MLVLLPPSETKTGGGDGPPLDIEALSFPALNGVRDSLVDELDLLADDLPASLVALGLSERQSAEVARNAELRSSPTLPALARYTGVLYDALDFAGLGGAERARAQDRLAVCSALFGLVRGADPIPAYRLSAGSKPPKTPSLREAWRPVLEPLLAEVGELLIDLRSGAYAALARAPHAVAVRVLTEDAAGRRKVVSHHNKSAKGRFARALAVAPDEPRTVAELVELAGAAGLRIEPGASRGLDLIVSG